MVVGNSKNVLLMETARALLMHISRVERVTYDEEGIFEVFGMFVSPVAVIDALECGGF